MLCVAVPEYPHEATNLRTKRCDLHQKEFEQAARRYRQAKYKYAKRKAQGKGKDPGDRDQFIAAAYTLPETLKSVLTYEQRGTLARLYLRGSLAGADLQRAADGIRSSMMTGEECAASIQSFLALHAQILEELDRLSRNPGVAVSAPLPAAPAKGASDPGGHAPHVPATSTPAPLPPIPSMWKPEIGDIRAGRSVPQPVTTFLDPEQRHVLQNLLFSRSQQVTQLMQVISPAAIQAEGPSKTSRRILDFLEGQKKVNSAVYWIAIEPDPGVLRHIASGDDPAGAPFPPPPVST